MSGWDDAQGFHPVSGAGRDLQCCYCGRKGRRGFVTAGGAIMCGAMLACVKRRRLDSPTVVSSLRPSRF